MLFIVVLFSLSVSFGLCVCLFVSVDDCMLRLWLVSLFVCLCLCVFICACVSVCFLACYLLECFCCLFACLLVSLIVRCVVWVSDFERFGVLWRGFT